MHRCTFIELFRASLMATNLFVLNQDMLIIHECQKSINSFIFSQLNCRKVVFECTFQMSDELELL